MATTVTTTNRLSSIVSEFAQKRASRSDRLRERRTALAMSEEARIHAQAQYCDERHRQMAS